MKAQYKMVAKGSGKSGKLYKTDKNTSARMSAIHPNKTKPEIYVQQLVRELGYKIRTNVQELPGRPDIVIEGDKKIMFVHGCFWHRHPNCKFATIPSRNKELWEQKFSATVQRDRQNITSLTKDGWSVLVIWECTIRQKKSELKTKIKSFLNNKEVGVSYI